MGYTASDGTEFEDRDEWRKYEFETNYTFKNQNSQKLCKLPGSIDGQPFDLADLESCEVALLDHSDQVQVDNLSNCRVFIGPSSESVFVRNCANCVFTVACKQLRTRDCVNCDIYLYSLTDPIIEASQSMRFAPFNGAYNGIRQHFSCARLDPEDNHWNQVYDFSDPEKTGNNFCFLGIEEESEAWVISLVDHLPDAENSLGECENPVPRTAQAKTTQDDFNSTANNQSMQSFSFETSQEQAEAVMDNFGRGNLNEGIASSSGSFGHYDGGDNFMNYSAQEPNMATTGFENEDHFGGMNAAVVETWPKLEEFEAEMEVKLQEKKLKEEVLIKELSRQSEEDIDKYYGERTDRLAHRAATNREQEEEKVKTQQMLKEKASEQPWTRVMDLVDTNVPKRRTSSSDKNDSTEKLKLNCMQ